MPDTTPASDRPTEVLAATIESVLRESLPAWWQTPPRLDWAALAVARQLLAVPHAPAVWSDGDPLMEAVASAVWEQCRTENSIVVDDPRNIAAVAATVARQLLGTTTTEGPAAAEEREPVQLRWGLDDVMYGDDDTTTVLLSGPGREPYWVELDPERTAALRDALAGSATPPAPADRAATLREAANGLAALGPLDNLVSAPAAWNEAIDTLHRMADQIAEDEAAAGVQPPTTTEADTVLAAAIPEWEAVYEPGNVSDYLIGYANTEAAAKGAAIAWVLSQTDKTADRLEWDPQNWNDRHDAWFDLVERHDDGVDTGVGVTVRHRLHPYTAADFVPDADGEPAAPAAPEEPTR
ncbi:hypothetical protein OG582_40665 (plasmid) [Streptomyces anulatus]|uniref:hypothetical protein n=1 Tax=Streptomyces anulatus TaxID=1892 RepID=UPI003251CDE6